MGLVEFVAFNADIACGTSSRIELPHFMADLAPILADTPPSEALADLQSDLESLRTELDHSQRLATLGTLAAGIAHEINNLLTPVLAYAQLAAAHPEDRALQAKAIEKAAAGVEAAAQIAQAMLGFSKVTDEAEDAGVAETLKKAFDCIGRDLAKDRITVDVRLSPTCTVRMRPLALQQVFMNLILNARSAMGRKGGRLTVRANVTGDGMTVIEVADTGPGIPKEIAGRLFRPFVSTNMQSKPGGFDGKSGTGLGLSICRRLVDDAGGNIIAKSKPGEGATFLITLPSGKSARLANAG